MGISFEWFCCGKILRIECIILGLGFFFISDFLNFIFMGFYLMSFSNILDLINGICRWF